MADSNEPTKLSDLMQSAVNAKAQDPAQAFARQCWNRIAGVSELKHTCATFLTPVKPPHKLPLLIVYIDSSSLVVEYKTDKMLYLTRLEAVGLKIRDVDFKLSKNAAAHAKALKAMSEPKPLPSRPMDSCPELTESEKAKIAETVAGLPENVARAVSGAMAATMRRDKSSTTRK